MRSRRAICVLAALCLAFSLTACGGSGASQDELNEARQQGVAKARQQAKIAAIQKELKSLRRGGGDSDISHVEPAPESNPPPPSEGSGSSGNCGGGLSANQYTTCGFAENVEDDYYAEIGSGSGSVYSYSPTTGHSYTMYCTAGSPHECTGGNDAGVYFP